ncbi:uncharacterized protein LOC112561592 [Pomacea canaliculata]|uniref:uncharacterized protein LOC112561592 n=1 Tax=Pomacea canaliculata TaxID=400727 RepID=UPI000D72AFC0|nr:uncharacterized protein LOC112561592 [Pomacea canaliculata]
MRGTLKCSALLRCIFFLILVGELFIMDKFLSKRINWRKSPVVYPETKTSLPTVNSLLDNTTVFATLNVVPHNNFNILTALTSTSSSTGHPVTTPTKGHVSHSSYTFPGGTNKTGVTVPSDPLIATKCCVSVLKAD